MCAVIAHIWLFANRADLRGTAVTRLALSNCTVPEIASITGHAMETVQAILDAHYLGGRLELAESAIKKLNAAYG